MKIEKTEKEIIVTLPRFTQRYNPYDDKSFGKMDAFVGVIVHHNKNGNDWNEMGLAYRIDMDYKGKDDQTGSFAVMFDGEEKEFLDKCKELEIDVDVLEV